MTDEAFAKGMAILGVAFNREIQPEVLEVYRPVLGDMTDAEWERAVNAAVRSERYFPPPSVLLRGSRPMIPQAEAAKRYDQILECYERGRAIGPREVREMFGEAAMEAFVSAGGTRAFSWCEPRDEPFRRKAFIEAWMEEQAADPAGALPPGPKPKELPEGGFCPKHGYPPGCCAEKP